MNSEEPQVPFKFKDGDVASLEELIKWIEAEQDKVKAEMRAKSRSLPPPFLIIMYEKFPRRGTVRRLADAGAYVLEKPDSFDGSNLETRRRMIQDLLDQKKD